MSNVIEAVLNEYDCGWCGYKFWHIVAIQEKHQSTQVRCPECRNYLKTWEDGKMIKEGVKLQRGQNQCSEVGGFK